MPTTSTRKSTRRKPGSTAPTDERTPAMDWPFVERLLGMQQVRTMYLWGPPGIGKTYCAYRYGRVSSGVWSITLTEDTPATELRGHYLPAGDEMIWHDGPFTAAMRAGGRLVINELSHGAPEVMALLYPVLESEHTAQLTLPTNETVRPASGFHVICTDNAGPECLPPALQDRFDCVIDINAPHPEALAALEPLLRRAASRTMTLDSDRRISLRGWLAVQRLTRSLGLAGACTAVFGPQRGALVHDAIVLGDAT